MNIVITAPSRNVGIRDKQLEKDLKVEYSIGQQSTNVECEKNVSHSSPLRITQSSSKQVRGISERNRVWHDGRENTENISAEDSYIFVTGTCICNVWYHYVKPNIEIYNMQKEKLPDLWKVTLFCCHKIYKEKKRTIILRSMLKLGNAMAGCM